MHTWAPEEEQLVKAELARITALILPDIHPAAIRKALEKGESADLFNGIAGKIIFYLHLRDPQYLPACLSAAEVLLFHPATLQPQYYTLYTGATGLIYLCIKLYEAAADEKYLVQAQRLARQFEQGILGQVSQDDLVSGHAGNILVLTHLYAYTQDDHPKELIRRLSGKLLRHARIAPQGLRWGHIKRSFDCLTGFSHGASGIAYALLQAAAYFNDEGLQYLAEQALDYEMAYYDEPLKNWIDLRLTSTRLEEEDARHWQIARFRKYTSDVNSWAHGAAGIGLARLYAWQVTGKEQYAQQACLAVQRSLRDIRRLKRGDFTLCSGYGGLAALLSQAAAVWRQPALQQAVQQLAVAAVHYYQQHGTYNSYITGSISDHGLFSGLAGVGYLLQHALSPYPADAITHPLINMPPPANCTPLYAPAELKYELFSRYYPKTLAFLQQQGTLGKKNITAAADINELETLLQHVLPYPGPPGAYLLEQAATALWKQHKGLLYYTLHKERLQARAGYLLNESPGTLLSAILLPVENIRLCYADGAWHLLYSHEYGVSASPAAKLTAVIFQSLSVYKTLQVVIHEILHAHFPDAGLSTQNQLTGAILGQVRALLQQCLIESL
jgi:hypothetical protein